MPRLAEVARAATIEAETHPTRRAAAPRSRLALVARVGIAVALIPLVLTGLAFAGVTVPSPARSAFDAVGITLPNQPADHSPGNGTPKDQAPRDHKDSVESETTTTKNTEEGNSDAAHKHALEQHKKAKGKALGHEKGKAIGLNDATPPGQAKEDTNEAGPPSHSNAGGNSAIHTPPVNPAPTPPGNANGHSK